MKKLIALLFVCTVINCTLSACGKEESSRNSTEKSVSQAETTETVTTEEETTESKTTETTTQSETTETTEAPDNTDVSEESIVGMWAMNTYNEFVGLNFKNDGNVDIFTDITDTAHFTSDGRFFIDSDILEPETDGTFVSVKLEDMNVLTITKDFATDSFDGIYTLTGGILYGGMSDMIKNDGLYIIVSGETMYMGYRNVLTYSTDGNKISMYGLNNFSAEISENIETTYEIQNNVLVMHDFDNGNDWTMSMFRPFDDNQDSAEVTTVPETPVTMEDALTGTWHLPDANYGFRFNGDGTGNVFMNFTEMMHFTADGKFIFSTETLDSESIQFDGTRLSVIDKDDDLLTMTRKNGSNMDTFDGEYIIQSGQVYESSIDSISKVFNQVPDDMNLYAFVNGEKIYIEFSDIFTYSTDNGNITFTGLSSKGIPDGSVIPYRIDNDKFILTNNSDTELVFQKIDFMS